MLLRLGPSIFCLAAGLCRAIWLSAQLSGFSVPEVGYLLLADLPVAGALALIAFAEARLARRWRALTVAVSTLVVGFYAADLFAAVQLNARLQASDVIRFSSEIWVAASFLNAATMLLLLGALACLAIRLRVPPAATRFVAAAAVVFVLLPLLVRESAVPVHLQKYSGSVLQLPAAFWAEQRMPVAQYGAADVESYRAGYDAWFSAPFARTRKDVVLVIVESLSAADSARTSGIGTLLPRFDDLSRRGTLFRNFFANYEASEGGIVALLSGVPPLHYPTASTLPFDEYAMQPTIVEDFRRAGYRCEFLTSVPLRFLSMYKYLQNPRSGFQRAAGQQEIERFKDAPRFAFESPADHVLFEELLARFDARPATSSDPLFLTAVTATSHPPFIDPRGGSNSAADVWAYVQNELWWLHDELDRRGFFGNGILVVTGDHRKMFPVRRHEQERYGDSAKARVPLLVIGAGVAPDVLDDRLFQQSDLLRMLDRAVRPSAPLSPFAVWVNRYIAVLGFAANASNVEVFTAGNGARDAFPLKLRGAEIEWLRKPANPLPIERAIHQQRAMQQAARLAAVPRTALNFGRDLAAGTSPGMLVTLSNDLDVSRDPDDARGSLKAATMPSFDREQLAALVPGDQSFAVAVRAFFAVPEDGEYWFSAWGDDELCLAVDTRVVLGRARGFNSGTVLLRAGLHRFDLRYVVRPGRVRFELKWLRPGQKEFEPFPQASLIVPAAAH